MHFIVLLVHHKFTNLFKTSMRELLWAWDNFPKNKKIFYLITITFLDLFYSLFLVHHNTDEMDYSLIIKDFLVLLLSIIMTGLKPETYTKRLICTTWRNDMTQRTRSRLLSSHWRVHPLFSRLLLTASKAKHPHMPEDAAHCCPDKANSAPVILYRAVSVTDLRGSPPARRCIALSIPRRPASFLLAEHAQPPHPVPAPPNETDWG